MRAIKKLCKPGANHNIVFAFEWGKLSNSPYYYIDMELCDFNLETYILRKWEPPMSLKVPHFTNFDLLKPDQKLGQILTIMKDIANGVAFIHLQQETHRDLKPRNGIRIILNCLTSAVLYCYGTNNWKIADYSLSAELASGRARATRFSRGTASYRAPELVLQSGDKRYFTNKVDIWAMACLFYEVVFHQKAFSNDFAVNQYYKSQWPFTLPFDSPEWTEHRDFLNNPSAKDFLSSLIMGMLRIVPAERPAAREVLQALNSLNYLSLLSQKATS